MKLLQTNRVKFQTVFGKDSFVFSLTNKVMSFASTFVTSSAVCTAWLAIRMGAFGRKQVEIHDTPQFEHGAMLYRSLLFDRLTISRRDRVGYFLLKEHGEIVPGYFIPDAITDFYVRPVDYTIIPYPRAQELDQMMKESCTVVTKVSVAQLREKVSKF